MLIGNSSSIYAYGANQFTIRNHNERLILTILRDQGACTRGQLSKKASLSPQAVLTIVQRLEEEYLIARSAAIRGKIGQPSIPFKLNPDGPMAFGMSIGRRTAQFAVVDLLGEIRAIREIVFDQPVPDEIRDFAARAATETITELDIDRARIGSFGVSIPFKLW